MNGKEGIRITLLGDIFPAELPYTVGYGIRTQFNQHKGIPWVPKFREITGENDLIIGNLESPLVHKEDAIKKTFYGEVEFASFLEKCGINVLNIANNHILEQGPNGFRSTVNALQNEGLGVVGNFNGSEASIYIKEINSLKIAVSGFSNVDLHVIKNKDYFSVLDINNVLNVIRQMQELNADIKILCFHWGNEYVNVPSLEQRKLAHKFVEAGADIIIGHHPHVMQPYEKYQHGHIFYSLGNFIFDFVHSRMVSLGQIAHITIYSKNSIGVKLRGLKISYKETVAALSSKEFEKEYGKIKELENRFSFLKDDEYKSLYQVLQRRNHLRQRILMKLSILNEFLRIRKKDKLLLIRNVLKHYLRTFN